MSMIPFTGISRTITETSRIVRDNPTRQETAIGGGILHRIASRHRQENNIEQLEEIIDIDRDIKIYNNSNIDLLNPRILYRVGRLNLGRTGLIKTSREETLSVTTEPVNVKLLSETTIRRLKQEGRRLIHLGMIVIGVKGLVKKQVGGKLLLIIMDKSW